MALSTTQLQTLKADILADPVLAAKPMTNAGHFDIAAAYAVVGSIDVWRPDAHVDDILNAIDFFKYTPADAADSTAIQTNRLLAIQTKQMNLQIMCQGRDFLNMSLANVRLALKDAVTAVPAGAGGANVHPGSASGTAVLQTCLRKANRGEVLFSAASETTGTVSGRILVFEGEITVDDVAQARELP